MVNLDGLFILFSIAFFYMIIVPFFVGFFPVFFFSKQIFSNKKNRFYIKQKDKRVIISFIFSLCAGLISYLILNLLPGYSEIANQLSKNTLEYLESIRRFLI